MAGIQWTWKNFSVRIIWEEPVNIKQQVQTSNGRSFLWHYIKLWNSLSRDIMDGKKIHQGLLNTKPEISKPEIRRTWKLERREPAWYDRVLRYSSICVCYSHCQRTGAVCQDRQVLNLNKWKSHYIIYDVGENNLYILYHNIFLLSVHIYIRMCVYMYVYMHTHLCKSDNQDFLWFQVPFRSKW